MSERDLDTPVDETLADLAASSSGGPSNGVSRGAPEDVEALSRALNWAIERLAQIDEELSVLGADYEAATPRYELDAHQDIDRYRRWLKMTAHLDPPVSEPLTEGPLISVVVPVYRPMLWYLERCIDSVRGQTYPNWELCLCDDGSGSEEVTECLNAAARSDQRIRVAATPQNSGISAATNLALELATGEFVAFLDHDDEIPPHALDRIAHFLDAETDVLYTDEDKLDQRSEPCWALFKPDWAPDLLLSYPYLGHFLVVRRGLLEELGGLRPEFDGSQDYDLMLRATERARKIVHVPEVLYHWRIVPGSAAGDSVAKPWAHQASRRALSAALERRHEAATVEDGPQQGSYNVRRHPTGNPLVSIIVPFRNEAGLTRQCIDSIARFPGYDNWEIILVDNDSDDPEIIALREQLAHTRRVRIIDDRRPFNWSAINNRAAELCEGDIVLFLNNDTEARQPGWLDAMVGHAMRPEVGAVGARLLYPDRTVQHAGVAVGVGGIGTHILRTLPEDEAGYMNLAKLTTNWSAVTGACLMSRRDLFIELGGFDEAMAVAYSDIDYCLKLRAAGYLVVYTPLAEFTHFESRSRGITVDPEMPLFARRWESIVPGKDPYFNPNLSKWSAEFRLPLEDEEHKWLEFATRHLGVQSE